MEKAKFRLKSYKFTQVQLDFNIPPRVNLDVSFCPKGVFHSTDSQFDLLFITQITCVETGREVINVVCESSFLFEEAVRLEDIPGHFYPNSLAIMFPYVRAFVSTISLLANVTPIILPTLNVSKLEEEIKNNTEVVD